jgi:hypothetical protein
MEKAVQRLRDSPEQPYLDKKCFMSEALNHVRVRYRYYFQRKDDTNPVQHCGFDLRTLIDFLRSPSAKVFCPRTTRVVSSMEYCG